MFDQVFGLPVHVLVIHAVVVLGPLAALAAIGYAVRPAWRRALHWPLVVLAAVTGVTSFVAGESGEQLEHRLLGTGASRESALGQLIHTHAEAGDLMKVVGVVFMVVVIALLMTVYRPGSPLGGGSAVLTRGAAVVLVVLGLAVLYQVTVTGHTGAKAAWSTTG